MARGDYMRNSVSYFSFAVLFTFLLSIDHVMTHETSKGNEQAYNKNSNGNNFKYPTSFHDDLDTEKRHDSSRDAVEEIVPTHNIKTYDEPSNYRRISSDAHYFPRDYQHDELIFRFGHPRFGQITVPLPFTNSMFAPPKAGERNSLYPGYQPLGWEDFENFEDGRVIRHRKIMTRPSKIDATLFHMFPAKASSMTNNGGKPWYGDIDEETIN
ncbi:hypothetical protein HN51_028121 [Arachis hypogaea]|uniref:uncharacterized protein n=1 Tax=Arachis hypogaea TaxID=3818 RepID=UPI000DEC91AB|nr:uncharacterized protein LOC112710887 [Arachis hypogaea]QHO34576.1 uncharacterized protein DS421_9g268140 [Arachis hypogaea]